MGLLAKRATAKLIGDVDTPLGSWDESVAAEFPLLDPVERLAAAVHVVVLGKGVDDRSHLLRSSGSLLGGDARVFCGEVDAGGVERPNWSLLLSRSSPATVQLSVPAWRTIDDELADRDRFLAVRSQVAELLASGPRLARNPGPPALDHLIERTLLPKQSVFNLPSPFADDAMLAAPSHFADGASAKLSVESVEALAASSESGAWIARPGPGSIRRVLDLSGGGGRDVALELLVEDGQGSVRLRASDLAAASETTRQRLLRAVVSAIERLSGVELPVPEDAARLCQWRDELLAGRDDVGRVSAYHPLWSDTVAADSVPAPAPESFPLGVVCRTRNESLVSTLLDAQTWLLVRYRTWHQGVTKRAAEKSRRYLARRPALISRDGKILPVIRYAQLADRDQLPGFVTSRGDGAFFWEVRLRSRVLDDGRRESLLFVTAASRSQGSVGYGVELLALLRAFVWLVVNRYPEAELETLTLAP